MQVTSNRTGYIIKQPTGYAQAHGRNAVSWEDKFAVDVWYSRNISLALDCPNYQRQSNHRYRLCKEKMN